MTSLFDDQPAPSTFERLEEGAVILRGFAALQSSTLVEEAERIARAAPFRRMITPGGYTMSVAMT